MLRTIGAKRESKKAKLIPLSLFPGGITIQITLNPRAFYVNYTVDGSKKIEDCTNWPEVAREITSGGVDFARRYEVSNITMKSTQYKYDDETSKRILKQTLLGYNKFSAEDLLEMKYVFWTDINPSRSVTYNIDLKNVTKIQCILQNNLALHSPFARNLERYNKGIEEVQFEMRGIKYPPNYHTIGKCNSLNTWGSENSSFFYQEYKKGIKPQKESEYAVNQFNYSINSNTNTMVALWDINKRLPTNIEHPILRANTFGDLLLLIFEPVYLTKMIAKMNKEELSEQSKYIEFQKISAKTVYALNFEAITTNESINLKESSIDLVHRDAFTFSLRRILNYQSKDVFYNLVDAMMPTITRCFLTYRHSIDLEGIDGGFARFNHNQ
jgi:hypothetical protein